MGRLKNSEFSDHSNDGKIPLTDLEGLLVNVITRDDLNALEFANVSKTHAKYLARRPSEKKAPFTYNWFLKVHKEMFSDVWKWAGVIRKTDKNIGLNKIQIGESLKNLEKDYHVWITSNMNPMEITARLHHRLVFIHPFENGNGRWARLITNIYLRQNDLPLIMWPEKELLKQSNMRKQYLDALRKADEQNLKPLMNFHKILQVTQQE